MKKVLILFSIFICFFASGVFAADQVEINTATLQQLDTLTGIGPVYAQAIIDARPFSSVDDLLRVKGIGPKTLQKIKDQGLAYVAGQTQQPVQPTDQSPTVAQTPVAAPTAAINEQPKETAAVVYPAGVIINEILPNPKGADETDEWIELYNSNNFDVDLSGWQIQDKEGTVTTYTIPQSVKISLDGFLVFKRPDTKIMLNNDKDGLDLLTPDKKIVDSVDYTSAPLNQSYNKTYSGWQWSLTLTPGAKNIITGAVVTSNTKTLPKATNSVKNEVAAAGLADLSQNTNINQDSKTTNPWFLFFTVLATTVILAAAVLFIKFRIYNNK
jgi:competence ComEA-like helix-hairpin-helix protein